MLTTVSMIRKSDSSVPMQNDIIQESCRQSSQGVYSSIAGLPSTFLRTVSVNQNCPFPSIWPVPFVQINSIHDARPTTTVGCATNIKRSRKKRKPACSSRITSVSNQSSIMALAPGSLQT